MKKIIAAVILALTIIGSTHAANPTLPANTWEWQTSRYAKNSTFGYIDGACAEIYMKDLEPGRAEVIAEPIGIGQDGMLTLWYHNDTDGDFIAGTYRYSYADRTLCAKHVVFLADISN